MVGVDTSIKRQFARISLLPKSKQLPAKYTKSQLLNVFEDKLSKEDPLLHIEMKSDDAESKLHEFPEPETARKEELMSDEENLDDLDDTTSWNSSNASLDGSIKYNEASELISPSPVDIDIDIAPAIAVTQNPIIEAMVNVLLQCFQFKEKTLYLRQSAAIMLLNGAADGDLESYFYF
jgi:hypothetical protein